MGKRLAWILGLACVGIAIMVLMPGADVDYQTGYDQALALAKSERKPVLLDFSTSWCPPCKQFRRARQEDAQVIEALGQVILYEIDCERGNGVDLASNYEVERYPTFVLLTPDGDIQQLWSGFYKEGFLSELQEGLASIE